MNRPLFVRGLGAAGLLLGLSLAPAGQRRGLTPFDFGGRYLVAVSDADMVASAYIDDRLGPVQGRDTLSVVALDRLRRGDRPRVATLPVSNSVTGPPAAMAMTRDGRTAIVIETLGPRPVRPPNARLSDLPLGRTIAVLDLSRPDRPRIVQRVACPAQPVSLSIDANGTRVAVAFGLKGAGATTPLALYRLAGGRLSDPVTPRIPGWTPGHSLIDAEFAPAGDTLALLDFTGAALSFVRVAPDTTGVSAWGDPVALGKAPYLFLARFTPDGRHVLANTIDAPRGTVFSVRVGAGVAADGKPTHRLVSQATTGGSPEGLAVSPDGRWVATSNLEQTSYPKDDPRQGFFSTISLLRMNPETGELSRVGDYPFEGILSETVLFDNGSRYLATTSFDRFDHRKPGGSIEFWRIAGDAADPTRAELVRTGPSIPVVRGVHTMLLAR